MQNDPYPTLADQYLVNIYSRYPITLEKGEGAYVWDVTGKKYLDFFSGIGCASLGYKHPLVTRAIVEQAQKMLHTSGLFYSPPSIELAKWLVDHGALDRIFFCNSGAESNEAAIKLARKYQWRKGLTEKNVILSVDHSFHGRTLGALAATAKPKIQEGFGPLPLGFKHHPWEDIDAFCAQIDEKVAAVILEPIQGEGGVQVPPEGLLPAVRAACDARGALLIFDEVQCGMGRTGKLFAYQCVGVKPDILTSAKGIANGMPLGIMCAQENVASALMPGDHGTTFYGNAVSCSAALATLQVIHAALPTINALSRSLFERLQALQAKYPTLIKEVRGAGLMIGIETFIDPKPILAMCHEVGLLINVTSDTVLRMLPPFIITEAEITFALTTLDTAFAHYKK